MSWAAISSGFVQFLTRFAVGHMYDHFGFKLIFNVLMVINALNGLVCYHVKMITWLYFLCIELNYFVIAGTFAVFPAAVVRTFGIFYGPQVYSLILIGSPLSSILNMFCIKVLYLELQINEVAILLIGSIASILAIIVNHRFEEKIDF